jgi:hypothetical protein
MKTTTTAKKLKWVEPGDPTRFRLDYPPHRALRKARQWDCWLRAMMMDTRLNSRDRVVLTTVATHYNLKTGECSPALGRLAIEAGLGEGESGVRAVRRSLAKAAKLGWIERTMRAGHRKGRNRTNLYELTLPPSICNLLASIGYRPPEPISPDYKYPTTGPRPDKIAPRPDNRAPQNRVLLKHSVCKHTASFADAHEAHRIPIKDSSQEKEEEFEGKSVGLSPLSNSFSLEDVEHVQNLILAEEGPRVRVSIAKIVGMGREPGMWEYAIDGRQIGAMARAGYLRREGDDVWLDETCQLKDVGRDCPCERR